MACLAGQNSGQRQAGTCLGRRKLHCSGHHQVTEVIVYLHQSLALRVLERRRW